MECEEWERGKCSQEVSKTREKKQHHVHMHTNTYRHTHTLDGMVEEEPQSSG